MKGTHFRTIVAVRALKRPRNGNSSHRDCITIMAQPWQRVARSSAGGMALHRWDTEGKLTTIHVVMELSAAHRLSRAELARAVQARLLKRTTPGFRPREEFVRRSLYSRCAWMTLGGAHGT